jgi:hypothetical protein
MQPEVSLRAHKRPTTGPYPEPDESIQYHPILFLYDNFNIIAPTKFNSYGPPQKNVYIYLSTLMRATCTAHLIFPGLVILIARL